MLFILNSSAAPLNCSAAQLLNCKMLLLGAKDPDPTSNHHSPYSGTAPAAPEPAFGLHHSTTFSKSSPCLSEGTILTHMVPDLANWRIRVRGVLLFGASEGLLNHPGADLDDPMVPMPEDGAHRDGQILPFYVKWWNLIVPKCTRLRFWTPRIVQIDPRVLQGRFRCSEKQHTSHTDLPFGKIGHHTGQNGALA